MDRRRLIGLCTRLLTSPCAHAGTVKKNRTMTERNTKLDRILAAAAPEIAAHWKSCRQAGLDAMTEANTDAVDAEIRSYFHRLKTLPDPAADAEVLAEMQRLYQHLNALNDKAGSMLLETDERELLVPLFIEAAAACGVDPQKYDGEPGGEYRDF
jgi:hypothetical protein